jgi:hypothetical protein
MSGAVGRWFRRWRWRRRWGGGSGGSGAALVVAGAGWALVGAVGVTDDVTSSTVPAGPRNTSSTPDTTIAATAADAAMIAVSACLVRYHGVGAGVKLQVPTLNASKWPFSSGSGWLSQKLSPGSFHTSSSGASRGGSSSPAGWTSSAASSLVNPSASAGSSQR